MTNTITESKIALIEMQIQKLIASEQKEFIRCNSCRYDIMSAVKDRYGNKNQSSILNFIMDHEVDGERENCAYEQGYLRGMEYVLNSIEKIIKANLQIIK